MRRILSVWPTDSGLVYEVDGADPATGDGAVDVDLDGRRIWSFRPGTTPVPPELRPEGPAPESLRFQEWPAALVPWLRGRARIRLTPSGGTDGPEATVDLGGGSGPVHLADRHGRPLVVNKWGRLGHALADADLGLVGRMLDSMDRIRDVLTEHLGPRVYVTGGTLLGPVREGGRLLPHDDDADLAYLSRAVHPADVVLESFALGRALRAAGFPVVRLSAGHLQVLVEHEGVEDHYVDVFTGFRLEGRWYQHFGIGTDAGEERLLPPGTVQVEGRPEPAPADPEFMLETIYGPGWRTPDPGFTFDIPPATADRFYGWFADYNVEREPWEDEVLLAPVAPHPAPRATAFARWVDDRTPRGERLLELGCGLGGDALALGAAGRTVHAVDFSRHAVAVLRQALAGRDDLAVTADVVNLLDLRAVLRLAAECTATPGPWTVFGRRLLNALEDRGRDHVFRLCGVLLRRGGAARFDLVADRGYPGIAPHRHLTLEQVVEEAGRHGLVLDEAVRVVEPMTWFGAPEERLVESWRTTFRRRTR
ncbi:hypothetical protein ACI789_07010 [Geodermatophilus sp. SYSU D00965]